MAGGNIVQSAARAAVEGFSGMTSSDARREAYADFVAQLIAFLIALVIIGFIGKWLWNSIIVDLFSFAKPARSFWQIVGLMIFMALVR